MTTKVSFLTSHFLSLRYSASDEAGRYLAQDLDNQGRIMSPSIDAHSRSTAAMKNGTTKPSLISLSEMTLNGTRSNHVVEAPLMDRRDDDLCRSPSSTSSKQEQQGAKPGASITINIVAKRPYSSMSSTLTLKPTSQIVEYVLDEEWDSIQDFLKVHPSLTLSLQEEKEEDCDTNNKGHRGYFMTCQGVTSQCTLLHLILQHHPKTVPLSLLQDIVKINPLILSRKDQKLGMLPLHLALFRGCNESVIELLLSGYPEACQVTDNEDNLPLHYASTYYHKRDSCCHVPASSSSTKVDDHEKQEESCTSPTRLEEDDKLQSSSFFMVLSAYPEACSICDGKERLPIHLLMSRAYDHKSLSIQDIKACIEANPSCLKVTDKCGRLPLHLACHNGQLCWDILNVMIQNYPEGLVVKDKTRKTPYQLAKARLELIGEDDPVECQDNEIVLASLAESTNNQLRLAGTYNILTRFPTSPRCNRRNGLKKKKVSTAQIDLYNCYG